MARGARRIFRRRQGRRDSNPRPTFLETHALSLSQAGCGLGAPGKKASDGELGVVGRGVFQRQCLHDLEPLERVGFQDRRHCFRSYIDDIPEISETRGDAYRGHASTKMLRKRYTQSFQVRLARDAMRFDAYLTGHASGKVVPLAAERRSA
jgi:hypothetical protein